MKIGSNVPTYKRHQSLNTRKIFDKLGKSIPKSKHVVKNSPRRGIVLDQSRARQSEIFVEAINNLSTIKDSILNKYSYDVSLYNSLAKPYTEFNTHISHITSVHKDVTNDCMNDSFGSPRSQMSPNTTTHIKDIKDDTECDLSSDKRIINEIEGKNSVKTEDDSPAKLNQITDLLKFVLEVMDIKHLYDIFSSLEITFNDLLFLTKDDLREMNIQLSYKNRILNFSEAFKGFAKDYSLHELKQFFLQNKLFVFNPESLNNLLNNCNVENRKNNYESDVLSTANFNNDNTVHSQKVKKSQKSVEDNYTLANYVSDRECCNAKEENKNNYKKNSNLSFDKSIQTDYRKLESLPDNIESTQRKKNENINLIDDQEDHKKTLINDLTITNRDNSDDVQINESDFKHSQDTTELNQAYIENTEQRDKHDYSSNNLSKTNNFRNKFNSTNNFKKSKKFNKTTYNDIVDFTNLVNNYFSSYKELKENSERINNRLKCIIKKSKKSKSKDKNKYHNCNSVIYNDRNIDSHISEIGISNEQSKYVEINPGDLEIEEERNLNEEMNKIINRIDSASRLTLDSNSMKKLDRIKHLASENIQRLNIDHINKEINKLYELIEQKKTIQNDLSRCNTNIIENKKLLKMLDEENFLNLNLNDNII